VEIVEQRLLDDDEALTSTIKAVPAIALPPVDWRGGDLAKRVIYDGCPTPEEACALIKRAELDDRILRYAPSNSDAMRRCAADGMTRAVAEALARAYYPVSRRFPMFLAATISHIEDEETRLKLVENLSEEHGNLEIHFTHDALFRRYARALGVEPASVREAAPDSPTSRLLEHFETMCRGGPDYRALAMECAFETLFSPVSLMMADGLRRSGLVTDDAVVFFDLHGLADVAHSAEIRVALIRCVDASGGSTGSVWDETLEIAEAGARLTFELFDSIARS
jgi:pyrroloquinoline quinone (PQQ) biosynthesis protein C